MTVPAARLGDPTSHGGSIVAGLPTVLIGGAPAARVTDMHACPMVTGVVPHVGGPVLMGSVTVLVGNMPQARVGDMATCVGPPDSVVMGCPTVLVGMGGAAGGGGGGAGGASAAVAGAAASGVRPARPAPQATALGDGRFEARVDEALAVEGEVTFVALALRAVATLSERETGRAARAALRDAGLRVTAREGAAASVRVGGGGRVEVALALGTVTCADDLAAHADALERSLWVALDAPSLAREGAGFEAVFPVSA